MFEAQEFDGESELLPYRKTTWARVKPAGEGRGIPDAEPAEKHQNDRDEQNARHMEQKNTLGIAVAIRRFVARNEDVILFAVVLLLLCDCDDDIELVIAAVVLFYPKLADLFH